jgi:hypothetical protein
MKALRIVVGVIALLLCSVAHGSADPAANTLVRCADLVTVVGEGELIWASGAQTCSASDLIVTHNTFTSWISNNGSCAGSATLEMTFSQMTACAVLYTLHQTTYTFSGSYVALIGSYGHYTCGSTIAANNTYTLPSATAAPTSASTELSWTPNASNTEDYHIEFTAPGGIVQYSVNVTAGSTSPITYYGSGQPAGAWQLIETGLTNATCSGGVESSGEGIAQGTAGWYQ